MVSQQTIAFDQFSYVLTTAENAIQWEIDFFPRGIRYNKAQLINVFNMPLHHQGKVDVPETILRTVRVRCTCKANLYDEQRFKVSSGIHTSN